MDSRHRELRAQLSSMAPARAIAYIMSFDLPPDESACLIECDVRGRSYVQVCERLHLSPEAVKRARRRAYGKIAGESLDKQCSCCYNGNVIYERRS